MIDCLCVFDFPASFSLIELHFSTTAGMDTKYCSGCYQKRPISSFLKDPSAGPNSRVLASCIGCCAAKERYNKKQKASHQLGPNNLLICLEALIPSDNIHAETPVPPNLLESRLEIPMPLLVQPPNAPQSHPEPSQPPPPGFLPAEQWQYIQNFNATMD